MIIKFIKFCVVGFCGMIIDFSMTYFFKEVVKINRYVANSIGFITAISFTYFINRTWTFQSTNPDVMREYAVFLLFSLSGLLLNTCVLYFIEKKLQYNFYVSKFLAIVITAVWNFGTNYFFTFA